MAGVSSVAKFNKVLNLSFEDYVNSKLRGKFELKGMSGRYDSEIRDLRYLYDNSSGERRESIKKLLRALIFKGFNMNYFEFPLIFQLGFYSLESLEVVKLITGVRLLADWIKDKYNESDCRKVLNTIRQDKEFLLFNITGSQHICSMLYYRILDALLDRLSNAPYMPYFEYREVLEMPKLDIAIRILNFFKKVRQLQNFIPKSDNQREFLKRIIDNKLGFHLIFGKGAEYNKEIKRYEEMDNRFTLLATDVHYTGWLYRDIGNFECQFLIEKDNYNFGYGLTFLALVGFHLANSYVVRLKDLDYKNLAGFSECDFDNNAVILLDDLKDIDRVVKANML